MCYYYILIDEWYLKDHDGGIQMDFQVVTISVSDLERSKRFYEDILKFEPGGNYEKWQSYKLNSTGGFGIIEVPGLNRNQSMDIINFEIDHIESYWHRIKDKVNIESDLQIMPWGTYKFVIIDPDGFRLGFVGNK